MPRTMSPNTEKTKMKLKRMGEIFCFCHFMFNSSPPEQEGRHFADDVFRCIFIHEKFCILIKISLKFVPKGPIGNNGFAPNKRQAIIWTNADLIHWRIYSALGGYELTIYHRQHADIWSHPGHNQLHPPTPSWSHKGQCLGHEWTTHLFCTMSIDPPIPELRLFQTLTSRSRSWEVNRQGNVISPVSNRFTSFCFTSIRPTIPEI